MPCPPHDSTAIDCSYANVGNLSVHACRSAGCAGSGPRLDDRGALFDSKRWRVVPSVGLTDRHIAAFSLDRKKRVDRAGG